MTQVGRQDGLLHPTTVREVRALADRAHQEDGVAPLGEQTLLNLADPAAPVVHLLAGTGEVLEGYGQVEAGATMTAELVVTPRARNKGLGRALVAEVLAVAAENDAVPAVWAHGDLPAARAVASGSGLAVVRELWQMGADLPLEQEPAAVPDGVRLRPFVVGQDEHAWLAVNARAFAAHPEQGRMTLADLEAREREPWFDAADLVLAERDGVLVASVWLKIEPGRGTGELYVLGVDPDAQGQGLGRLLTARAVEHLTARGLDRIELYVSPQDEAALRTYTRAGLTRSRVDVQYGRG